MANVKVAVRVRPLTSKESADGGRLAVQVEDKYVRVRNVKLDGRTDGAVDSREKLLEFGFDYCYWSVDPQDPQYTSQEEVFQDLGVSVLAGASEGYNVCLFAYGQTGSGKTYTMMGSRDSVGLTPRICEGLFSSVDSFPDRQNSSRVEISFLEIYNERVRDLLRLGEQKKRQNLRVREHPEKGPYVQDLSQHVVTDYKQALDLLEEGVANRITAATHNHEASSRSHAIFTIQYTQAILENNLPSEIVSKINLVDLAGSERADPHYCRDRLTEGSSINKSLVTLGIVISALAQNSQMSSSCQSINSMASEGEASLGGSVSISHSGGGGGGGASGGRRHCFIPYRDSVLTWLLKDSLGGNSKTIMIATVSPSGSSYNETLSTLRYAAHARNIVNKPRVNEDASVRLIRELRQEVDRLKSMLLSFQMQRNLSPSLSEERDGTLSDMVLQNELKVEQLTQDWSEGWRGEKQALLEQYGVDIDGDRAGVLVRSLQPHLVSLDRDVLSTGVLLHHLREGVTLIGPHRSDRPEERQIVVQGDGSCEIVNEGGVVTLRPMAGSVCVLNDKKVTESCRLAQGSVITLGSAHRFRFNHPAEAAVLRERRRAIGAGGFRELCQIPSASSAGGGKPQSGSEAALSPSEESAARQQVEEQQWYVETLRREIQSEQRTAERELEREQAHLQQQQADVQQWILQEKQRLLSVAPKGTQESGVQADLLPAPHLERFSSSPPGSEDSTAAAASVPDPPPPRLVRARKKAVQDELLRILALRRAERRVRRKRLHLQLERIARKRHLLEAKRELQRLEQTLPPGLESPGSPEPGSPYGSRGQPSRNPRRHSFSVETLSRLYPQHPPIYSHYLKRNRSTERTLTPPRTGDCFSRRWLSDECLPRERSRSCSSSRVSSGPSLAPGGRAGSSENLKETVKEPPPTQSYQERPERKPLLTNRSLTFKNSQNPRGSLKSPQRTALQPISNEKVKDTPVENPKVQKIAYGDFRTAQESQGVGTIGKVFFRSVGPGLKTALTKVFRKPPAGMNGRRNSLQVNRTNRLHWRNIGQDGGLEDGRTERHQCALKMTVSCEELDQRTAPADLTHRHWHSTEALMDQTSSWVEQLQPGLAGWAEDEGGGGRDEGSSDCDSLLSVDSLSSAYAAVLAERLRREEALGSESDSADSQMSKDSLAADGSALRSGPTRSLAPTYARVTRLLAGHFRTPAVCTVLEQTNGQSTQGTPAEDCRGQNGGSHVIAGRRTEIVVKPPVHKTQDEPVTKQIIFPGSPGSPSSCSTREPDLQLALTDAWSSTDAADSPSVSRECSRTFREKTLFRAGNMNSSSSSSPSLISVDLSDCQGRSRSCISTTCSSAEGVHVTVGNQNVKASTALSDTLFSDTETPPEPGFVTTVMVGTGVDNDGRGPTRQHKILESVQKITADVQTNSHLGVEPLTETSKSLSSADIEICHSNLTRHQPIKVHQLFTGVSPMESPGVINSFETVLCTSSQPLESCVKTQSAVHEIYTEDNELLSLDETEKLNNVKPYKNTDAKEFSTPRNQTPLMFEAQRSEPALPEHELVHPACKSSRKRNKELTETVAGGLKIPKRSVEVTPETFRARQIAGREVCWPDGNGDNMDAEEKVPNVNEDILYPDLDHANMDARTESQPRGWKRDQAEENVSVSDIGAESNNTGSLFSSSIGQMKAVETDRKYDGSTDLGKQFRKSVGIVDQRRRPEQRKTTRQWDAICSAIDLRIAEVVQGHLASASLTAGDPVGPVRSHSLAALWPPAAGKPDAAPTRESETQTKDDGGGPTEAGIAPPQRPSVSQGEVHNELRSDTRDKICALVNDVTIRSPTKVMKATDCSPNVAETTPDIPPNDYESLSDDAGTNNCPSTGPVHLTSQPDQVSLAHGPREPPERPPPSTRNDGDRVTRGNTWHSTPASPNVSSTQPHRQACPAASVRKPEPPQPQNIFPDIPARNVTPNGNSDSPPIMDLGINLSHVLHDGHIDACKPTSVLETVNHFKDGRKDSVAMTTLFDREVNLSGTHRRASSGSVDVFAKSLGDIPEHLANESSKLKTERKSENWRITKSNQKRSKNSAQTCVVNMNYHNNPAIAKGLNDHSIIASCVQNNTIDQKLGNTIITESQVSSIMTKNETPVIATSPGDPSGNTCADGAVSNSNMSTHGNTKQRNHTTTHRTGKSKRFRRSNATVRPNPSSSSDSTVPSSSDEDDEMLSRVNRSRLESTPLKSSNSRIIQTGRDNRAPSTLRSKGIFPVETLSSQAQGINEGTARECCPKRHLSQPQQPQSNQNKERTTPYLIVGQSDCPVTPQESRMHFASSDINPFVHQWQEEQLLHKGYKIPVFGSAADLSSKSPPLNGTERHMTRCCSVDNGLNGQNSPFNSHLSTFVNHKGLSSTLSSGEDYKEQGRTTSRDVSDASCPRSSSIDNGLASLSLNSGSSCHDVPRGLGADSSVRVDEIMLLYSPEQGSSLANTAQTQRCRTFEEHGTQTGYQVMKNLVAGPQGSCASIAPGREHSRTNRHQRSRTHVPTSLRTKEDITQCPTWASMENMSVHLSQLIHSTSDLLGDVQGMRTGETLVNPSPRRIGSNVTTPRCTLKDSTRTQSSFDIGIQTEANSMSSVKEIPHQWTSPPERSEPHEVNVIVKVIGSDSLRVSFEKGFSGVVVESPRSDDRERSKSDLRSNTLAATESTELHLLKTFHSLTSAGKPTETKMCSTTSSPSSNSKQSVADTQSGFSQTSHRLSRTTASVKTGRPPCSVEQTRYTDRASSPIVTLGTNERPNGSHYSPCQGKQKRGLLVRDQDATHRICGDVSSHKSGELASLESVSQMSLTESSFTSKGLRSHVVRNVEQENSRDEENNNPCSINRDSAKSPHQTTLTTRNGISRRSHPSGGGCHGDGCSPEDVVRHDDRDTRTAPTTERPHGPLKCGGISTSSSLGGARTPEDDALSTAPSESSTDVLLNTNPVAGRAPPPPPAQQHHPRGRLLPEDLPMHNKFSHWSGISETQRRSSTRRPNRPDSLSTDGQPPGSGDPNGGVGMEGAAEEGQASIVGATLGGLRGRKTREIERLRWEREQVMASVRGEVSAPRLTVELAEARLHYGLGETDALLRMLSPAGRDEAEPAGARPTDQEPAGASPTNQELCDRHRRSADWSRQEREARLQSSRRARSLSPSRHPAYLQLLRQEVMDSTREPSTGREEGRYPSEIQHLLRDYGRAREEACGEIARARERLRHRTELEKRRLQQQAAAAAAAAAAIKDDASRFRAGTSSSTLCTDSSLSLSSGHTSGYVSGHTPQRQTPGGAPPRAQDLRFDDEGSKVRVRPPPCGSQGSKGPRRWLSTQDFQLVSPASEFKPLLTSSPAAVPTRQRSSSFGSASSSSSTYQNMASGLLSQALLEIRLAAAGDTANLLLGKASAGWRHEGEEQGIQAYYRPFCSPTAHGFLGAGELDGPLADLWDLLQQPSNCRLYNSAVRLAWTRPLDGSTQLVYVLTNPSVCNLSQPRDFCCLSVASKQGGGVRVLAQQSVFEESLPRPSVEAVRGEMMPSAWCLQPITRGGLEVVRVVYLLQVDLGSPALPSSQLGAAARRHASVVAELGSLLRAARPPKRGGSLP